MRLNEQRNTLVDAVENAACDLIGLRSAILRKMRAPYGDGSRSNMINAETDVLPRLQSILDQLDNAMQRLHPEGYTFGVRESESVRIW